MDVKARNGTEWEAMTGIVAMLVAFAGLADLASRAPYPARAFLFWLLRRAEAVAREWVDGPAEVWPVAIRGGDGPADALDLAASFRELACAVRQLVAQYRQLARRRYAPRKLGGTQSVVARLRHAATLRALLPRGLAAAPCPDTS